jgi:tRNA threonylcarbamoyladenosine biosynthesis protein TsaE
MRERIVSTNSAEETVQLGREIAARLRAPVLVLLHGELGTGKTTLAKGIVAGLGAGREEDVTSPTFTLVHVFQDGVRVYHIDLYRIADFHDLETLGLEDVLAEPAVVIVEWPERLSLRSSWPVVNIFLEHGGNDTRRLRVVEPDL